MLALFSSRWQNKSGTGDRETCNCGSWKNHWINYSGSRVWPTSCCVYGCNNRAEVGGHVTSTSYYGEWIVPMCKEHNNPNFKASFALKPGSYVAKANRGETCGY